MTTTETEKEITILDERIFRPQVEGGADGRKGNTHSIRLDRDSYIICFEGRRGGGKTTAMTMMVVKAVARCNMKVISNYPIEFMLRRFRPDGKSYLQHVKSEDLDFEKLIMFDDEYKHVLICIDEAPDIISHMASQSWRNRLVAAFTRQIRKNYNTLFLAAQDFELIDKSMRWQVDVIIECKDAARHLGDNTGLDNGEMLWLNWYDNSGQWTGYSTDDRIRNKELPAVKRTKLFPRVLWGDKEHEPVFNSWHQIDILDSLRKVDLKLTPIKIRDSSGGNGRFQVDNNILKQALGSIEAAYEQANPESNILLNQQQFYRGLGPISTTDKDALSKMLPEFGIERTRNSSSGKFFYILDNFDLEGFRQYVTLAGEVK